MRHPHLTIAHQYWKNLINAGRIIDATAGNGHDSIFLLNLLDRGKLSIFDIQKKALENTKRRIEENLPDKLDLCDFYHKSHDCLDQLFEPESIDLIVYNLGYLPGANKNLTTQTSSTIASIKQALKLIKPTKGISITCYPGHIEGQKELYTIYQLLEELDPKKFQVCYHTWINREKAPTLFWIIKN